jgi:hypothetical protein
MHRPSIKKSLPYCSLGGSFLCMLVNPLKPMNNSLKFWILIDNTNLCNWPFLPYFQKLMKFALQINGYFQKFLIKYHPWCDLIFGAVVSLLS